MSKFRSLEEAEQYRRDMKVMIKNIGEGSAIRAKKIRQYIQELKRENRELRKRLEAQSE